MTARASEPRTTMKVPVSFRDRVKGIAKESNKNMMQVLVDTIETGATAAKQVSPASAPVGGQHES